MASNYADGMPDGLTFKSEQQKQDLTYGASEKALTQFLSIAKQLGTHNTDLQEEITDLIKQQQKLYKRFDEEQAQRNIDAKLLKQKGASDEEIIAYLSKRQDTYEKDTKALFDSFGNLHRTLEGWIEEDETLSGQDRVLLRKQLEVFQKSYDLDEQLRQENEKDKKKRNAVLDHIAESVKGTWKEALENGKEERKDAFGSMAASLLGPLRVIADPISKFATGKTTKDLAQDVFDKWTTKEDKDKDLKDKQRDEELESALSSAQQPLISSVDQISDLLTETATQTLALPGVTESRDEEFSYENENPVVANPQISPESRNLFSYENENPVVAKDSFSTDFFRSLQGSENESLSEDEGILADTNPAETDLLRKGGVIGAAAVFLGKEIRKLGEGIDDIDVSDDDGFLDNLMGGKLKKTLTKLAPTLASAAGVAAVAAVPVAMLAGGLKLQERDTEDAKKYAEQGNYGRAVETAWLGDRSRLTEENANSELGRATGKTALIAGGAAGVGALAAGGAAAGMSAGAAAAAGGAGLLGTGLAAAGATASAVFPPALIAAAIAAGVTVIAKGTQEAFELGWDKNQAEIQKNLYDTIYSEDSSVWEKIKASVSSGWKEFTGTLAGGIRGASEELEGDAAIEWQRGIEYLEKTAAEGNKENSRLLTMLQSEEFKALSDKDQEMILKSEGLFDEYQTMLDEAQNSFGESLLNGLRATGDFFKGAVNTKMEALNGKKGAAIDAQLLKDMDKITGEDVERLKNSTAYAEALSQGKNKKQAMEAAYLDEKHRENAALGIQKENGVAVGFNDYAITYFQKKKTDEDYRQTHEYSQEKAKLMQQGYTSEEADLKAIQEYNEMYEQALTYRLKQTKDYREHYKKCLKEGKSMAQAEKESLQVAKENTRNTMTVTELIKDKFSSIGTSIKETFTKIGDKVSEGFNAFKESDFVKTITDFTSGIWNSVTEWFGKIGNWFSEKWDSVTGALSGAWDATKEGFSAAGDWIGDKATRIWNWVTGSSPDEQIDDGIVTKDGKIIQLSPDDNVYATKNMPTVVGDADAQRAMPSVPTPQAEFTDKGIIAAIQVLTEVLKSKNMSPEINIPDNSVVGFDQYRSA